MNYYIYMYIFTIANTGSDSEEVGLLNTIVWLSSEVSGVPVTHRFSRHSWKTFLNMGMLSDQGQIS